MLNLGPMKGDSGGHGLVPRVDEYLNLGPDFRFAPPGTQESWKELASAGGEHLVILETLVGGALGSSKMRPELGETIVAVSPEGTSHWRLLAPAGQSIDYTDAGWEAYASDERQSIERRNSQTRAAQRAQHTEMWNRRREVAKAWLLSTPETPVPALPAGYPANNPIDHFLAARIEDLKRQQQAAQAGQVDYFRDVQPIFEAVCWDCHRGGKSQGGLRLDSLASADAAVNRANRP